MPENGISGEQGTNLPPRTVTKCVEDKPAISLEKALEGVG